MNTFAVHYRSNGDAADFAAALKEQGGQEGLAPGSWWYLTHDPQDAVQAVLLAARYPGVLATLGAASAADSSSIRFARDLATGCMQRLSTAQVKRPLGVAGENSVQAQDAEAALVMLARIIGSRTHAEWRVVDLLTPGVRGQYKSVASELGISTQAVSKAIHRTGWHDEIPGRELARRLLDRAAG